MSIGNLKTDGNKGNNFPWQLKMLKGLQGIINAIASLVNINIIGPLGQRVCVDSVSTTLCDDQANVEIIAGIKTVNGLKNMLYYTGATSKLLTLSIYNQDTTVSILVSTDNGVTYVSVPKGVTINYDAGGLLNYFNPRNIYINQNSATIEPLIIYTYLP
jgi:ligand-binding sensor domain-containing protein